MINKIKPYVRRLLILCNLLPPRFEDILRFSKGLVHVGGNVGQEVALYDKYSCRVLWVEPIPTIFEILSTRIEPFPKQTAIMALLADKAGRRLTLNIANNDGASSSIFDLARHKEMFPEVNYCSVHECTSRTLDDLLEAGDVDPDSYDFLVMDVQGAELLVLQGGNAFLRNVRFIRLEATDFEAYKHAPTRIEICNYLKQLGFYESVATPFEAVEGLGTCYDLIFQRKPFSRGRSRFPDGHNE